MLAEEKHTLSAEDNRLLSGDNHMLSAEDNRVLAEDIHMLSAEDNRVLAEGNHTLSAGDNRLLAEEKPRAPRPRKDMPNVVVIYADDLGFGDLSCYGATRVATPHVDSLAEAGLRFRNAHAAAATSTPSRYGMLTGEYPWRRKGTGVANGDAALLIRPDRFTLPRVMQQAGYVTGAVGKWHLGLGAVSGQQDWNQRVAPGPYEIGYDYSYIMAATADRVPCVYMENQRAVGLDPRDPIRVSYTQPFEGEPTGRTHPELLTKLRPSHGHDMAIVHGISRIGYMQGGTSALWHDEHIADTLTHHAVRFIQQHAAQPFFLYFGTNDVHVPRYPADRFRGKSPLGLRGDAILQFDWCVGQIVRALKEAGVYENTLILLSSDNGPVVDDGYQDQAVERLQNHKPWGPYRGGKYSAFEAGTRVPFIVHWPGRVRPGVSDALVSQIDMLATFAQLVGQDVPQGEAPDSRPQLPTWLGRRRTGRDHLITSAYTLTVVTPEWKYIEPRAGNAYNALTSTELGLHAAPQLYHLPTDRGEYDNLAPAHPSTVRRLQRILEAEKQKGMGMDL